MTPAMLFGAIAAGVGAILLCRSAPSWASCALFALLASAVALTGVTSLGRPRPLWAAQPRLAEATVVAYVLDEGKAIYLWIAGDPPMAYCLPWDERRAAELHHADERARATHSLLRAVFDPGKRGAPGTTDDEKMMFYASPQQPLPPKQGE
jgi:hypothetical protein